MNTLSKEQLLLLQQHLTYEVYEKFISMFDEDEDEELTKDQEQKNNYILQTMKKHHYWGEISGWGDKRVYKNIFINETMNGPFNIYSIFKGNTKKELLEFLDKFRPQNSATNLLSGI
jgi:hypothetical protein